MTNDPNHELLDCLAKVRALIPEGEVLEHIEADNNVTIGWSWQTGDVVSVNPGTMDVRLTTFCKAERERRTYVICVIPSGDFGLVMTHADHVRIGLS